MTTTVSTSLLPSSLFSVWRKLESTREPPSIMTDLRPREVKMEGREDGGIRPIAVRMVMKFTIAVAMNVPLESSGTGTTLAPACSTSLILSLGTFEPQRIHGCFNVCPRKAGFVFHSFRIREVSGKRRDGSRMSGWGGGEAWVGGRRLAI